MEKLLQQAAEQTAQGKPNLAIETFQQLLTLARQQKDKAIEAAALVWLGFNYDNIGQPAKALEYYNQALPIAREVGDPTIESAILQGIEQVNSRLK